MKDDTAIEAFKAIGHPLRFKIVEALRSGEFNVGEIEQRTGIGQPTLSQQLAVLRKAGLVETRKKAKLVFYKLDGAVIAALAHRLALDLPPSPPALAPRQRRTAGAANFARIG